MFFYGTLCDLRLCEIVLGRSCDQLQFSEAVLHDHAIYWARGQNFPVIVREQGSLAKGLLLRGLDQADIDKLDYYESGFDYAPVPVTVETDAGPKEVTVYYCDDPDVVSGDIWSLSDWSEKWGQTAYGAAEEFMYHFGKSSASEMDPKFPMMERRAHSWRMAQEDPDLGIEAGAGDRHVEVIEMTRPYTGFFAVRDYRLHYRQFDGSMSAEVSRAAFVSGDASLVLPYDPETDQILVLEQFRIAPFARGDKNPWLFEPIAGMIDLGETPETCARREAEEEAGLNICNLIPISKSYPSPGGSTTFFHSFLGICDLKNYTPKLGGLDDENEDIRPHLISVDHAIEMAILGRFRALPLAMMVLWLQQYRQSDLVSRSLRS